MKAFKTFSMQFCCRFDFKTEAHALAICIQLSQLPSAPTMEPLQSIDKTCLLLQEGTSLLVQTIDS